MYPREGHRPNAEEPVVNTCWSLYHSRIERRKLSKLLNFKSPFCLVKLLNDTHPVQEAPILFEYHHFWFGHLIRAQLFRLLALLPVHLRYRKPCGDWRSD